MFLFSLFSDFYFCSRPSWILVRKVYIYTYIFFACYLSWLPFRPLFWFLSPFFSSSLYIYSLNISDTHFNMHIFDVKYFCVAEIALDVRLDFVLHSILYATQFFLFQRNICLTPVCWMNEWKNEQTDGRTNERMNEQTNKQRKNRRNKRIGSCTFLY